MAFVTTDKTYRFALEHPSCSCILAFNHAVDAAPESLIFLIKVETVAPHANIVPELTHQPKVNLAYPRLVVNAKLHHVVHLVSGLEPQLLLHQSLSALVPNAQRIGITAGCHRTLLPHCQPMRVALLQKGVLANARHFYWIGLPSQYIAHFDAGHGIVTSKS
jgi:hypothetical protein